MWQSRYVSISGGLFDSGWTGVFALALVLAKLNPKTFLRVCNPLQGGHRGLNSRLQKVQTPIAGT